VGAIAVLIRRATDRRFMTDGTRIGDVELRVVELTGRAGDAFVMHCDTFHAAALNCYDEPRLMATNVLLRTEDSNP
jgi:ectoine hydroxylase-related dioxygenase (phytanoyl-CoA dioxygenase family)